MRIKTILLALAFMSSVMFGVGGWFLSPVLAEGYFGCDQQGGSTYALGTGYCWGNRYVAGFFNAPFAVTVDTFIIWCNGQDNNPKIIFGIYDVIGGVISNKIAVSDTLFVTGNMMQRWALPVGLQLAGGKMYTICVDLAGAGGPAIGCSDQASALSRTNNATFPKTWTDNVQANYRVGLAAHYRESVSGAARRRKMIEEDR